ncbi:peptidoglycan binding protein, LysM domain containing protein [Ligilactobacillus acidipiscis DSM 15836]|uniref:Peptidoglycan binding protein, LysM domain containing protein n=1 Tax=Ligilactobacillus acidipiscis DSM 15836 TaxID=1423716 RepID=A0ABR5PHH6_9LACO|nr:LysM peptidoglycan-binding domain-containing protein [Ligilactobacillus acidipiscis]KRM20084.1 peptidoglycan binding protein, LysM domain containing protein [Ligilactobacillus acidipiscis DSM 15836]GAW63974.1 peptidoglycan-binding protein LysM [Ligilactobacillus acidipiscis]GEN21411.1 peptidase M23 [Ligilactobacillus acidipiscis]
MNLVNNDLQVHNNGTMQATTQASNSQQAAEFSDALETVQQTIKIKKGDTVSELAEKYHTTTQAVAQANQLNDPDFILAGQNLTIPGRPQISSTAQPTSMVNDAGTITSLANVDLDKGASASSSNSLEPTLAGAEKSARDYIIQHESSNNYNARNGRYIGKYQLDKNYLHGDFSPANQEKIAAQYVQQRYGSWANAQKHWVKNHWY